MVITFGRRTGKESPKATSMCLRSLCRLFEGCQTCQEEEKRLRPASVRDWNNFIDRLQGAASPSLQSQLKDAALGNYYVLKCADDPASPPNTRAVLSRATLLLRIANGVCAQRLANAQVTRQDLEFWWARVGEDEGLWSQGTEPDPFADLWTEVDNAIEDTEIALQLISSPGEMSTISKILGEGVTLTQYSRAALWLLGVD